uniref:Receptor ligand binding region domain-containing protein n=1 Tax=Amphimedon queenslandica TaxID=400682 RepID=A0A1X7U6M4_AMPQE
MRVGILEHVLARGYIFIPTPNHVTCSLAMSASMVWQQVLLFLFLNVERTQSSYLNCSIDTIYPLRFVGFFPCLNQWDEVGDCDRLTLTAVERAIAEINQDTNILRCFEIKLLAMKDPVQETTKLIEFLYNEHNDQPIHGVIGPYHPESAKMFAYIFGHYLSTLQISYSVTSVLLDDNERYPYFHTTIPNDEYYSVIIRKLLDHFDWQKVAIISTFDEQNALVLHSIFRVLTHHNKHPHIFDSIKGLVSAELVLKSAKAEDFRIFISVMDPIDARNLLCQAYQAGLTTANAGMIKNNLRYNIAILFAYFSFILAALYSFKALQLFRDKKTHSRPIKRSRSTVRKKYLELSDEIYGLECELEKMKASVASLEEL